MEPPEALASRRCNFPVAAGRAGDPPDRVVPGRRRHAADPPDGTPPSVLGNVRAHLGGRRGPAPGVAVAGGGGSGAGPSSDSRRPSRGLGGAPPPRRDRRASLDASAGPNSSRSSEGLRIPPIGASSRVHGANGCVRGQVGGRGSVAGADLRLSSARKGYLKRNARLLVTVAGLAMCGMMATQLFPGALPRTRSSGGADGAKLPPSRGLRDESRVHDSAAESDPFGFGGWMTPSLRGYYDKMLGVESEEAGVELSPEERMQQQEQLIIRNQMEAKIFEAQQNALREIAELGGDGDGEGQLAADAAMDFTPGQVRTEPQEPRGQGREEAPPGWGMQQSNAEEEGHAAFGSDAEARAPEFEGQQAALGRASPEMEAASQQFEEEEHRVAAATAEAQAREEVRQEAVLRAAAEARAPGAGFSPGLEAEIERAEEEEMRAAVAAAEAHAQASPPSSEVAQDRAPLAKEPSAVTQVDLAELQKLPEERLEESPAEDEERPQEAARDPGPGTEGGRAVPEEGKAPTLFAELEKLLEERFGELPAEGERRLQNQATGSARASARSDWNLGLGIPTKGGRPL